jgi:hypothetical protein
MPRRTSHYSEAQREAIHRLCTATTRRHYRNSFMFVRGLARTFMVRTCLPLGDKMYAAAVRRDPCAHCGARPGERGHRLWTLNEARPRGRKPIRDIAGLCDGCARNTSVPILYALLQLRADAVTTPEERLHEALRIAEAGGSRRRIATLIRSIIEETT